MKQLTPQKIALVFTMNFCPEGLHPGKKREKAIMKSTAGVKKW